MVNYYMVMVLDYLKGIGDENVTSEDIAKALDMTKKSVDGVVTSGLQKKGLTERIPAEIELSDGTHKTVKFIKVTEAGYAYDHEAAKAEDAAAATKAE